MGRDYIHAQSGVAGEPGSTWLSGAADQYPPLRTDLTADVAVVGGGIVGALVTHELVARGMSVALLERRRIAGGTTGHSTAKITVLHDVSWSTRVARRGFSPELAQWAGLNAATPDVIGGIANTLAIACSYRRLDAHLVTELGTAAPAVEREMAAMRRLGVQVDDLGRMPDAPLGGVRCVRVANQAQFDPAAFATGLVASQPSGQVTVAEDSTVRAIVPDGPVWRAVTDHGSVRARHVVMTALAPVRDPALLFARIYPYAAYVLEVAPESPVPDGFWIQVGGDEMTLRPTGDATGPWIVAGQHVRVASRADERATYARLLDSVRDRFPGSRPLRYWSTHDLWTPDWLPFVGPVGGRPGLHMVAGFGGWGMSASVPAARLVANAIAGRPDVPLLRLLSPNRWPDLRALPSVTREGLIVSRRLLAPSTYQKHAVAAAGVTVVAEGAEPPRCTHLGCRLKVDTAEGTLDCPCHGSRFTGAGEALYGPAQRDLSGPVGRP